MSILALTLLIAGCVCFALAAFKVAAGGKVDLVAAGLALWTLSLIIRSSA